VIGKSVMLLPAATRLPTSRTARRLLSVGAAHFLDTARWLTIGDAERVLERDGEPINGRREAKRLCRSLGYVRGNRIVLTVRGLHRVRPKDPVLRGFKGALDLALVRFQSGDLTVKPTLSSEELASCLSLSEIQARCVIALMTVEELLEASDDGIATITPRIRKFREVETVPEYLATQTSSDRRRCLAKVAAGRRESRRKLFDRTSVKTVVLGAAATLLAALILWLGNLLSPRDHENRSRGPARPNSPAPRTPSGERAGDGGSPAFYSRKSAAARSGG